jgi:hypothetical protein
MSSSDSEYEEEILEAALLTELLEEDQMEPKKKRSCRQQAVFRNRKEFGHFQTVFKVVCETNDGTFEKLYRMSLEDFNKLYEIVEHSIPGPTDKADNRKICKKERFALTLRYLITGQNMQSISTDFLIAASTVSLIIPAVCSAIWTTLKPLVFPPLTQEKFKEIAQGFASAGNIPHCIGAIDGKHVEVQAFPHSGSMVFNYKKTFSLVLMAICDSNYKFIYVDVGAHGSESDGGIWRRSGMGKRFYNGQLDIPPPQPLPGASEIAPFCFVGDEAFGAHQNLLTPYSGKNLTFKQSNFNHHQSATRNIIERSFGVLARRFRIYNVTIVASEETVKKIVLATTAIHNFLMMKREPNVPKSDINLETDQTNDGYEFSPQQSRDILANYLKTNIYTVRVERDD